MTGRRRVRMEHAAERVTLARLPSGRPVSTTVHVYGTAAGDPLASAPAAAGPTLYVQAAQHGREVNGPEVCRRLHDRLLGASAADGTVVVVPVADPLTFDRVTYTAPRYDRANPNLNRVWPGDDAGTVRERMAARLWSLASEADAAVDLHTGRPDTLSHVVVTEGDPRAVDLARAFGTSLCLAESAGADADPEWHDRGFDGKFRVAAAEAGVAAITPELAHNREVVESAVATGVAGLCDVARHLGVLDGDADPAGPAVARNHLGRVTADASGLFRPAPDLTVGDEVVAGAHLGDLYDPTSYERLRSVAADRAGVLYALTREATVTTGTTLANVAERVDRD